MNSYLEKYRYRWLQIEIFINALVRKQTHVLFLYSISLFSQIKGSGSNDIPAATSLPSVHMLVSNNILQYEDKGFLKKSMILGLGK